VVCRSATAGLKSARSGNGRPLIASRRLLLVLVSKALRNVNRCSSVSSNDKKIKCVHSFSVNNKLNCNCKGSTCNETYFQRLKLEEKTKESGTKERYN